MVLDDYASPSRRTFNRTIVELKLLVLCGTGSAIGTFNRTIVELKSKTSPKEEEALCTF